MADEELGTGSIRIDLDDSTADAAANRLGDRIERVLDRASRDAGLRMERNIKAAIRRISPVSIRVEADLRPFGHSIDTLSNFDPIRIPVSPDVDRARFEAAIEAVLVGLEVSVRVVPDLDGFDAAIRAHNTPTVTVDVNADTDRFGAALSRLGGIAGRTGSALKGLLGFGAVGIAAASATQSVFALTAALAPAAGIVAALPAVIAGAVAANAALKLALAGVSDAFGAALTGSAEEFSKSLEELSPAAQAAAREVRALKPAFEDLRSSVQDEFFSQFEGQITRVADNLGGPLKSGLTAISNEFGRAAASALDFLASSQALAPIQQILGGTQGALSGLSAATAPVLKGFLDIAGAVADAFGPGIGQGIAQTGAQFGTFLSGLAASGRAVELVRDAVEVFRQLGTIASNVGGIVSGVFKAANDVGGGLLNNLAQITGQFEAFVKSAQGQEAIGNIFQTLSSVASQLGPILAALVTQIGAIAPALAPVFETLGPAIVGVINSLGPALAAIAPSLQSVASGLAGAFAAIGPALGPVGAAVGSILEALSPLLPVIGQLVAAVASSLAPVLSALAGALAPVISALAGALAPILPPLTSAFTTLATALTPLITLIGTTLGQAIQAVAPLFATLAGVFQQVAVALAPIIQQITAQFAPVFAQLTPLISQLVTAISPLIEQLVSALLPVLPPVIEAFLAIQMAEIQVLPPIIQLAAALAPFVSLMITALAPVIQFAAEVIKWLALNAVVPVITNIVSVITSIIGAVTSVLGAVQGFATSVVGFFVNLRANVVGTVSGLVASVVGFFLSLPGRARAAVSGLVGSIVGVFNSAKTSALSVVSSFISSAVSTLGTLVSRAKGALSGAAGALVSAGADLIRGFISGVKSQAGALVSAAKGVVSGAVNGAKSLLGISSPSKVFAEIGKFVGQGFIKGLTGTEADIRQAAEQVIGKIRDAFKGKNSRLDDQLIAQIQSTTKRLAKLAADRDAIAAKIKKANELAVSVTQNALSAFSLQNLAKNGGGVQQLTDGIESAITQIQKFNGQINSLAKRGLRKDLLSQIIGLGPEQGAALATSLSSATSAQLEDLNEAQKQLAAASKKLGRDSADNLFDAGKEASKGFLAGLKAQQDDVEDLMLTLARSMARSIRAALGIKSPSKVFRQIGRYTMDGLAVGVDDRLRSVQRSVLGAAAAVTDPFGGNSSIGSIGVTSGRQTATGGRGSSSSSRSQVNNITINEVGDGEATAQRILNRLALAGGGL
jgi:phage-related protein